MQILRMKNAEEIQSEIHYMTTGYQLWRQHICRNNMTLFPSSVVCFQTAQVCVEIAPCLSIIIFFSSVKMLWVNNFKLVSQGNVFFFEESISFIICFIVIKWSQLSFLDNKALLLTVNIVLFKACKMHAG